MHLPATSFTNNGTSLSLLRSCLVTLKQLCSFATQHKVTRWPRNCITTSQCVHNSPFPEISDKCGNSDFAAAWWPVPRCQSVQQAFVRATATCLLLMFHSLLRRKDAWTGDVDAVSHSTYSNLQYCFRTHSLELTAPLCIQRPMPIWTRAQYWSNNSCDTHIIVTLVYLAHTFTAYCSMRNTGATSSTRKSLTRHRQFTIYRILSGRQ